LQQVFGNILNNATKFTARRGHLSIGSTDDNDGRLVLTFKDDGIGMTPDVIDRLFHPFEQGADPGRYGGLGLGMAISKALVEIHAGIISADSEGPGRGAEFTVTLPSIHASTVKLPSMSGSVAAARRNPQGISILLVEDHKDSAEVMSRLLRDKGYSVESCATIADALAIASERRFNLVLSDIGLPDGTGVDLIKQLRQHSSIPAIALTGFGMDQDIKRYKDAGFDAHLTKPVNFQKLEMIINQFFSDQSS
jgi:CheY-like chemotaxis protein